MIFKGLASTKIAPWTKGNCTTTCLCTGPLLQYYLVAFFEPTQKLGLGTVGDPDIDRYFLLAVLGAGVRHFDRSLLVLVVNDCALGNLEHTLVLFQNDFSVRGHFGLQFTAGIVDGHAYLKGGDVVLLYAHG